MATIYHNLSEYDASAMPAKHQVKMQRYAIVVADWNSEITHALYQGAYDTLIEHGVEPHNIDVSHVPGTFELTYAASQLQSRCHAVIAIGCVVQGDTPHFDYICQGVTQGLSLLNTNGYNCPVIFGVLTTNTMQQALDRAGGKLGNKGIEAAVTALKMANMIIL